MLDILRDPVWQIFGIVLGAAIAIGIYFAQRSHAELSFGVISLRALLTVHDTLSSRIKVTLDEKVVSDVHLIVFAFKNTGNSSIRSGDFDRPVNFAFGQGAKVLSAEITRRSPSNLDAKIEVHESRIVLRPLLLNSNDHVVIQALVAAKTPQVICDARVVGVSSVRLTKWESVNKTSFHSRLGAFVLSLPITALGMWVIVSAVDFVFNAGLREVFTLDNSLPFGVFVFATVMSIVEEIVGWIRVKLSRRSRRFIVDV